MKITLLGDSIRQIGYGQILHKLLGDEFEIFQPSENCRFSKYTLRGLFDWEKDMAGSRIVHWNNGLWDVCDLFGDGAFSSEEEYKANMLRIADILLSRYDRVIFATTTPVTNKNGYGKNLVIERYNKMIVPLLEEKGVIINDLHSIIVKDIDRYIRQDDNIHLSEAGIEVASKQVADIIKKVAATIDDSEKKPETEAFNRSTGAPV